MLKKRVIFTLLYDNGSFMLSRNFRLQKVGNLRWLRKNYNFSHIAFSIDELIVLDVTRGQRDGKKFCEHLQAITEECFVPIAAGGGVRDVEHARNLLRSGADKVVVNSSLATAPDVVGEIAAAFGNQCVVAAVDVKEEGERFAVFIDNGTKELQTDLHEWIKKISTLPIGEVYLNSINRDGTGQGYHLELLDIISGILTVPLILAGGAGKYHHLAEGLSDDRVDAVATAHLFNFVGDGLEKARLGLLKEDFNLAVWDAEKAREMKGCLATPA